MFRAYGSAIWKSLFLSLSGEFGSLWKRSLFESGSWLGRFRSYDGGEFGLTRGEGEVIEGSIRGLTEKRSS